MRLREVDEGLWAAEARQRFRGLEIGTRMVVIALPRGGLFVWSPIALDGGLREELAAVGEVAHVVAPNRYHHMYVSEFARVFPGAKLWAAPGLASKRRDLAFDGTLSDEAPGAWRGVIDQVYVPAFEVCHEVVFFHGPTRSLLTADLLFHVGAEASLLTRIAFRLLRSFGRVSVLPDPGRQLRRAAGAEEQLRRVLDWPAERLIPAHGTILESDVREAIVQAIRRRRVAV